MLPDMNAIEEEENDVSEEMQEEIIPDKTYRLDYENKTISGMIDGDEAKKQAIRKMTMTEQEEHIIYGLLYGTMLEDLIGEDMLFVQSEIKARIEEGVLSDERFESVDFTDEKIQKNKLILSLAITTTEGENIEMEGVEIDV